MLFPTDTPTLRQDTHKDHEVAVPSPVLCITTPLRYVVDATPTPPAVGVVPTVKIPTVLIPVTDCIPSNFVLLSPLVYLFSYLVKQSSIKFIKT